MPARVESRAARVSIGDSRPAPAARGGPRGGGGGWGGGCGGGGARPRRRPPASLPSPTRSPCRWESHASEARRKRPYSNLVTAPLPKSIEAEASSTKVTEALVSASYSLT